MAAGTAGAASGRTPRRRPTLAVTRPRGRGRARGRAARARRARPAGPAIAAAHGAARHAALLLALEVRAPFSRFIARAANQSTQARRPHRSSRSRARPLGSGRLGRHAAGRRRAARRAAQWRARVMGGRRVRARRAPAHALASGVTRPRPTATPPRRACASRSRQPRPPRAAAPTRLSVCSPGARARARAWRCASTSSRPRRTRSSSRARLPVWLAPPPPRRGVCDARAARSSSSLGAVPRSRSRSTCAQAASSPRARAAASSPARRAVARFERELNEPDVLGSALARQAPGRHALTASCAGACWPISRASSPTLVTLTADADDAPPAHRRAASPPQGWRRAASRGGAGCSARRPAVASALRQFSSACPSLSSRVFISSRSAPTAACATRHSRRAQSRTERRANPGA